MSISGNTSSYERENDNKEIKNIDQGKTLATKLQNGISIRFRSVQDRFAVDFDIWQIEECVLPNRKPSVNPVFTD